MKSRLPFLNIALVALVTLLTFFPYSSFANEKQLDVNDPDQLKEYIDQYFTKEMKTHHVPGAAITIVKDGKVLLAEGYGYADLESKAPVKPSDTVFRIGSVSKNFTITALLQLYEQGKIDLNADINQYLKGFEIHGKNNHPITLHQLITHTAGFDEYYENTSGTAESMQKYLETHAPRMITEPGFETLYSNYGYALIGLIVQNVSGEPYDQYIENHIFKPLGMSTATVHKKASDHIASSYAYDLKSNSYVKQPYGNFDKMAPAGSISMQIPDMAPYLMAQLQSGNYQNVLLKEATSKFMQEKHFSKDPTLSGFAYGLYEDIPRKYRAVMHGGAVDGFRSLMYLIPEEKLGIAISTNSVTGRVFNDKFYDDFQKHFYPMAPIENQANAEIKMQDLQQYGGKFSTTRYYHHGIGKITPKFNQAPTIIEVSGPKELKISTPILNTIETKTFVLEKENLFVEKNGTDKLFFYQTPEGDLHFTMSSLPFAFEKLSWIDEPMVTLVPGFLMIVIVLLSTIILLLTALFGKLLKAPISETKRIRFLTISANFVYFITIVLAATYFNDLLGDTPLAWKISLYTAVLAFLMYLFVIPKWVRLLARKSVGIFTKIGYGIVMIAGLLLTPYLLYWNIVGNFF